MSQVHTSTIRPAIPKTNFLGSFPLFIFQNLHCDEKSSMMQSNVSTLFLFTFLIVYLYLFIWLILFNKTGFRIFSNTFRSIASPIDNVFFVVDADWLNALRRFPIS